VAERLAHLAADDLELVWLLGEAIRPLDLDELTARTAPWRPLARAEVARWCADAAGRDVVMHLALLAGGEHAWPPTFALSPAGAALATRLRLEAAFDGERLRALARVAPAAEAALRAELPGVSGPELEDWLAFARARGLVVADEHATPPRWELREAGRREAQRDGGDRPGP
jgi:hypothetical protein